MRYALLILFLAIGCIEESKVETIPGEGLAIMGFSGSDASVRHGERLSVYLTVQNLGDKPAEDAVARISKFGSFKPLSPLSRSLNGGHSFLPPNIETNTRGDIDQIEWEFEAPQTRTGYDYTFDVEVSYDYSSDSTLKTDVMTRNRYRQESAQIIPETLNSEGPIGIEMETENTVLDMNGIKEFKLYIELSNSGNGILNDESAECALGPVGCIRNVELFIPKGDAVGKLSVTECSGAEYVLVDQPTSTKVKFSDVGILHSGSTWLSCNIKADADLDAEPEFKRTYVFRAYTQYRYQVKDDFSIRVIGETSKAETSYSQTNDDETSDDETQDDETYGEETSNDETPGDET